MNSDDRTVPQAASWSYDIDVEHRLYAAWTWCIWREALRPCWEELTKGGGLRENARTLTFTLPLGEDVNAS